MTKPTPSTRSRKTGPAGAPQSSPPPTKDVAVNPATGGVSDAVPSKTVTPPPKGPTGKLGVVVALLARPEGATVTQISAATDWQAHSVRGAMAGALKKKHGLTIRSEPAEGGRVYRLGESAQ